jgi:hypothetical protein
LGLTAFGGVRFFFGAGLQTVLRRRLFLRRMVLQRFATLFFLGLFFAIFTVPSP